MIHHIMRVVISVFLPLTSTMVTLADRQRWLRHYSFSLKEFPKKVSCWKAAPQRKVRLEVPQTQWLMPKINLHRCSIEKTFSLCSQADHVHAVGSKIPAILFLPALLQSYLRRRSIDAESPLKVELLLTLPLRRKIAFQDSRTLPSRKCVSC